MNTPTMTETGAAAPTASMPSPASLAPMQLSHRAALPSTIKIIALTLFLLLTQRADNG
jgi:hypothetical protein